MEFQEFKRARQQQQQRHQQQQQEQGDKCVQIAAEFDRWNISNPSVNAITEVVECNKFQRMQPYTAAVIAPQAGRKTNLQGQGPG
jgi:hypothetical protein